MLIILKNKEHLITKGFKFKSKTLLIKYQKEYYRALRNKYGLLVGLILRFIFHFFKKENKKPSSVTNK